MGIRGGMLLAPLVPAMSRFDGSPMNRRGFTLIEVAVTLLVGVLLTTMAIRGFGNTTSRMTVTQARNSFASLHARARAVAIERGQDALFMIDEAGDSVWVTVGGDRIEHRDFSETMDVEIDTSPSGTITLCMTPRGFAETACNSFSTSATIRFQQGGQYRIAEILPLGQIRW